MKHINLTRITIGIMIIAGLLFFKPLAYVAGIMMIFAGLTGICFLEMFYAKVFGIRSSCSAEPSANTGKLQKIGIIISVNDAETCWNAFRFANFSLNSKDEVKIFLIAKGVEYQQVSNSEFNIVEQADKFLDAGGKIFACGTCLKQRSSPGSKLCPLATMQDMYKIVAESDKVLTF